MLWRPKGLWAFTTGAETPALEGAMGLQASELVRVDKAMCKGHSSMVLALIWHQGVKFSRECHFIFKPARQSLSSGLMTGRKPHNHTPGCLRKRRVRLRSPPTVWVSRFQFSFYQCNTMKLNSSDLQHSISASTLPCFRCCELSVNGVELRTLLGKLPP